MYPPCQSAVCANEACAKKAKAEASQRLETLLIVAVRATHLRGCKEATRACLAAIFLDRNCRQGLGIDDD